MKKLFPMLFITSLFIFLSGCANDQYAIEKEFWQAQKFAQKIFKNPYASPPNELERAVNKLNNFINKHPQEKLAIEAEFSIAQLYMVKQEYEKGRTQLRAIIDSNPESRAICAEALFLIGNSYEKEDEWNSALLRYKKIMLDYPLTPRGLDIPIYIGKHYKTKYQPDKMAISFEEAILHYKGLAEEHPGSLLAYMAEKLVARCYIELKDWQNAIKSFNTVIENYKGKVNLADTLMEVALIYKRELHDDASAKEVLQRIIKEYPHSGFTNMANVLLKELK